MHVLSKAEFVGYAIGYMELRWLTQTRQKKLGARKRVEHIRTCTSCKIAFPASDIRITRRGGHPAYLCHSCYDSVPRLKAGRKKRVVT